MTPVETLILASYFFVLVILAVYGWHRYYLVYLYMKNKERQPEPAAGTIPRDRWRPLGQAWAAGQAGPGAGGMFWLRRNRLPGS